MILSEIEHESNVELVSYKSLKDDHDLVEKYYKWLEDISITRFIGSDSLIQPKGKEFIENSFKRFTGDNAIGFFIRYKPDGAFVGTAKLDQISFFHRSAWDGIMIGERKYHGMNLGYYTYRILLAYAFQVLGLHKVNGGCNENNIAMRKVFEKIGYVQEGRLRKNDYIDAAYSDHCYFGILHDEFTEKHTVKLFR